MEPNLGQALHLIMAMLQETESDQARWFKRCLILANLQKKLLTLYTLNFRSKTNRN